MAILQDLLMSSFVRDVISRVELPSRYLSKYFGFGWDGSNITPVPGRTYTYDIFDKARTVPNARLPGAPAGTVAPNVVGNNTVNLARFAEKLPLDYNQLSQIRTIGKSAGDKDRMGAAYIDRQVMYLRERAENLWEFLAGSLARGGLYYFYQNGDDLVPTYESSSTFFGVDLQVPATNKLIGGAFASGLQMGTGADIITANWNVAGTLILTAIDAINSAFQDLVGSPLETILCGSDVWRFVLSNTQVINQGGSANTAFAEYEIEGGKGPGGFPDGVMVARLKALPHIKWIIWDGSIRVATSSATTIADVKVLPRSYCTFLAAGWQSYLKGIVGSEVVKDNDWSEPVERSGLYTWAQEKADPARVWYHTLQNVGIELNRPKAIATARVL